MWWMRGSRFSYVLSYFYYAEVSYTACILMVTVFTGIFSLCDTLIRGFILTSHTFSVRDGHLLINIGIFTHTVSLHSDLNL